VLFLITLLLLLFFYIKLKREDREFEDAIQRTLEPRVNRFTGQVGPFSLGSLQSLLNEPDEREPLLATSQAQNISSGSAQGFVHVHRSSNESTISDDTFLRHRSEYMIMKTFKPTSEQNRTQRSQIDETKV
jgi:hypothetical protein